METNDELTGSYVLIHPDLYFDPVKQQGYTGMLTFADPSTDEFYVSFGKDTALYASDSLMVLREPNEIYGDLMANMKNLGTKEIKDLYRIGTLQASGEPKDQKAALEIASSNASIRSYALVTMEDKLALQLSASVQQNFTTNRGR